MGLLTKNLEDHIKRQDTWETPLLLKLVDGFDKTLQNNLSQGDGKITLRPSQYISPTKIVKGDIICIKLGGYPHPGLVWKVRNNICYCLSMSTTQAPHNLYKITNSRLSNTFVTKTVVEVKVEQAIKDFVTVFDSRKELSTIFALAKEYYATLISPRK